MQIYPTELKKLDQERALVIAWSDGQRRRYPIAELRKRCPCASCREQRREDKPLGAAPAQDAPARDAGLLPVISAQEAQPLDIVGMKPVGNYAYSIQFNDGHDTGIFTFEFLRELGSEEA
jgi:DUF971 family protein